MGKSARKKSEEIMTQQSQQFQNLFNELISETRPARQLPMEFWTSVIKNDGGAADRLLAPSTESIRKNFASAREAIERGMPRGGAMDKAIGESHIAEAGQVGGLKSQLLPDALARLASMGVFGTQSGISSGNSALSGAGNLGELGMAQKNAAMGPLNSFAGFAGEALGSSSARFKTQISPALAEEALEKLINAPLVRFRYSPESGLDDGKEHWGTILEQADPALATQDGSQISAIDAFGLLLGAVQSLTARVEVLEAQK